MLEYGTQVVAGVTPGKGGQDIHGVPVYDFVSEACSRHQIDAALSFVPSRFALDAAVEVIDAGIRFLVLTAEGVPERDMMTLLHHADRKGTRVLGPDTPGLIAPGKCKVGVHPDRMFSPGSVGVLSKSGALSYEVGKALTEAGVGQSTVVGIGGGPLWGLTQDRVLRMFEEDDETDVVVLLGEVGGTMEYAAASVIESSMSKPVVTLIVGRAAPRGAQMGHAGAIVEGDKGTAASKIEALEAVGAHIARSPSEIPQIIKRLESKGYDRTH
jgi:succinyl-CoA synthetase alpha subunit